MLGVMTDFCDRTAITHVLKIRKGPEDHRVGSDSTGQQSSGFIDMYIVGQKKILWAVAGFHFHIWQPTISKWHNSFKTSQEVVCHLSRLTLTLMSRQCCCIKRSDTTFRVINKLNATGSMASGWRGAEFSQPKLQWTVQEVGSWAASELHTSTAVHPSPKPETTKAFAPHDKKELKQLSIWGTVTASHYQ